MAVAKWVKRELKDLVRDHFREEKIERQGLFHYAYIETLLDDHFQNRKDNRKQIWTLLMFALWYDRFIEGKR